jgi:Domain of unknown function (DUF3883)
MSKSLLNRQQLETFSRDFSERYEADAIAQRGRFLEAFPLSKLPKLQRDQYVIGLQKPTFCSLVEAGTKEWALIQGATSNKFGIYYGRTKTDPTKKYRHTLKFGTTADQAFANAKMCLINLIDSACAKDLDFEAIDQNPLSQMFKAKILSLYFPEKFLNVCSAEHLEMLVDILGHKNVYSPSQAQHLLIAEKHKNPVTSEWSNPKFMSFLYRTYVRQSHETTAEPRRRQIISHRTVNFEEVQAERSRIGILAEEFALEWERNRLRGHNLLSEKVEKIVDRRQQQSYGYDFESWSSLRARRFIEVKSVAKLRGEDRFRFFLSANEHLVSQSDTHRCEYFFYLVYFNGKGQADRVEPWLASELYEFASLQPASFIVMF